MANTISQESKTKFKQTSRIIFDGEDHMDAYAQLDKMDEKITNENRASAYFGSFYGKTGFDSFFNSIYVNTNTVLDKIKIAWRKLYDNIIKKDKVYMVTTYAYIHSYDSVFQEYRYNHSCFISTDPQYFEPISFDRFFRTRELNHSQDDEGDNYTSLIGGYNMSFDFFAFCAGDGHTIHGKNFDIIPMEYYGMYGFEPITDAGPMVKPASNNSEYDEREYMPYFPFLLTTNGIEYYNMISLLKYKKHNGVCNIYDCRRYWVVNNGMFVEIRLLKYDNNKKEVAGDYAYIYVPIDYKNKKTGKLILINNSKYKHFHGLTQKYTTSSQIMSPIDDCLVNCCTQFYDEAVTGYRHMRRIWFTMDKKGNISERHGLWDKNVYFNSGVCIPANGKTYLIEASSSFWVFSLDLKGNYTQLFGTGYNDSSTFDMFRTKPNSYINSIQYTDNGDGSYNMYPMERDSYGAEDTIKIGKVVTTRDFKTYDAMTIVNPCIIIPIPGRSKKLRIFLDNQIMESEKRSSSYNDYYNVKFWTDYAEKFSDTDFVRFILVISTCIRSTNQRCFFYKNGLPTGFSGFKGYLAIGEGDKVWYYMVFIGDLTLFTTSPKNFVLKVGVKEQYKSILDPSKTEERVRYLDQTLLNYSHGLPYEYYEEGETI